MTASFQSTYQQYKHRTSQALGWLTSTATELGIARQTDIQPYTVQELVSFATSCLSAGRRMPKRNRRWLKEAISLRRRVAERFQDQGCEKANSTHSHFIQQLELILAYFDPSRGTAVTGETPVTASETEKQNHRPNYFAVLGPGDNGNVADENDESLPVAVENYENSAHNFITKPQPSSGSEGKPTSDGLDPFAEDALLEMCCLLDDAHQVRQYIRQVWNRYLNFEIDLITAAVVTQGSLAHMSHMCVDLRNRFPSATSYMMEGFIYYQAALGGLTWEEFVKSDDSLHQRYQDTGWEPNEEIRQWTMKDTGVVLRYIPDISKRFHGTVTDEDLKDFLRDNGYDVDSHSHLLPNFSDFHTLLAFYREAKNVADDVATWDLLTAFLRDIPGDWDFAADTVLVCQVGLDLIGMSGLQTRIDADLGHYLDHENIQALKRVSATQSNPNNKDILMVSYLASRLSDTKSIIGNPMALGSFLHRLMEGVSRVFVRRGERGSPCNADGSRIQYGQSLPRPQGFTMARHGSTHRPARDTDLLFRAPLDNSAVRNTPVACARIKTGRNQSRAQFRETRKDRRSTEACIEHPTKAERRRQLRARATDTAEASVFRKMQYSGLAS